MIRPGHVIVILRESRKLELFCKDIKAENGALYKLFMQIRADDHTSDYYEQSVMVAEVVDFAADIKWLKAGDQIIIDYLVDSLETEILEKEGLDKVLILPLHTSFHTDDRIAYAGINSRQDTYTHRKGDVNENSLIYAIYRDGELIPNPPFLICEQKDFTVDCKTKSGLIYNEVEPNDMLVIRKIIAAPPNSAHKAGEFVMIERYCLYGRQIEDIKVDIIMEQDVLCKIAQ